MSLPTWRLCTISWKVAGNYGAIQNASFKTTYDVFLSFKGADTRSNFTSHLHQKLVDKNINTFIDDGLNRGEEIESSLIQVIEESNISVIVFSEGYTSASWCLDELVKILHCKKFMGRTVLPIFYGVDPSDVQELTETFGDGLRTLEAERKKRMDHWRNALKEAAALSGWNSNNYRVDSKLIEEVVKDIVNKIPVTSYNISKDLVGIDSQIEEIIPLLCIGSTDVRVIGLWGIGDIGKTTIAEALISRICNQFEASCFLSNVREESSRCGNLYVRKCLFSKLLGDENLSMDMTNALPTVIINRLRGKRVIVIIDDVNDSEQLETLVGNLEYCFGAGSRVIVTSRDKQVLKNIAQDIHEVKELEYDGALKLLSMKAFKGKETTENYTELLKRAVKYARGIPLALKVLDSNLCQRSPQEWEIFLNKLEKSPDSKIQSILKVSYDELEKEEKDIFLDIAVFFRRWSRNRVEDILECCSVENFSWGIIRLRDKCLLTVLEDDVLDMHDLIQEMGREIAQSEGIRLSNSKDICQVLTNNMEKKKACRVQGLCLHISGVKKICLQPKAFSRMKNLRLLKFYRSQENKEPVFVLESGLRCLPNMLSSSHWEEYPCETLPFKIFNGEPC